MESEQFKNFPQFLLIHKHQGTQRRAQVHNHLLSFSYPKANQVREAQLIHWFSIWYEILMVQTITTIMNKFYYTETADNNHYSYGSRPTFGGDKNHDWFICI